MKSSADIPARHAFDKGFQLGELRIDPAAGGVSGPGGREQLDPKVMDVLVLLAQHAGQVVLREDLLAQVWPDAVVTDDALSRCIYELRRQLSQAGGDEKYKAMLETLPKRGYRLNGEIGAAPPQPGIRAATRSHRYLYAVAALALAAGIAWFVIGQRASRPPTAADTAHAAPSIAVLPFVDMSPGQDQEHFSDGVSEEILNRLAQTHTLRVINRRSSFSFKDQSADIAEIAAKLDVTHLLEGSVRKSGNRVRITAQLVEASSGSTLWSETYDRELGDIFAIQDEIAASVAKALEITLASALAHSPAPASAEAYDLFLEGEFFYNRRGPGDVELAAKYYRDALAIDSGYARAWAALAGAYSLLMYKGTLSREEGLEKQGEAARKAVALDANLAVGHARLAQYYWDTGDRRTAYKIFDKAIALDADEPLVLNFAAGIAMRNGDIDGAIGKYRRIIARDPRSAGDRANLGVYLLAAGKLEEAKSELQKALELNPNFGWGLDLQIARIQILQKRFGEASTTIAQLPEGEGRDQGLALLSHALGHKDEADAATKRLAERPRDAPNIRLAEVYAFRGMTEEAFQTLKSVKEAVDRDEPSVASELWSWQLEMRVSPFLKPLHDDPRWKAMMVEPG